VVPSFFAELVSGHIAGHAATRDGQNRPEIIRVWGPRVDADLHVVTFYVLRGIAGRTLDNLAANGQVALTITRLSDYRTVQLKGRALAWRAARDDERAHLEQAVAMLALGADEEGLGGAVRRWASWPAIAVDIEVSEVYNQTPRPGTGARLSS
jgi:hypothetical protein